MKSKFTAADLEMFKTLRIPQELLAEAGVRRVTHTEAWHLGFRAGNVRMEGILYPCLDADGEFTNGRVRLDKPDKDKKYIALAKARARKHLCFVRSQFTDDLEAVCGVESEKAMLAATAAARRADRRILFFAMGGCWGAWEKKSDGVSTPIPELVAFRELSCLKRIMLDADVAEKPLVKMAEDNLGFVLGTDAEIVRLPPGFAGPDDKGPDDFIAARGEKAFWKLWDAPANCSKAASPLALFLDAPLNVNVEKAGRLLATLPEFKLYRRGNGLVHIVEEQEPPEPGAVIQRPEGNTYFTMVDADHLEMDLSRSGYVFGRNRTTNTIHAADPKPRWSKQLISQTRSRPEATCWKRIERISNVPLLLADGRIIEQPGYDERTRVWFDPRGFEFPAVPEKPNEKQARKAIKLFDEIYGKFPFTENSYAVALSLNLSLLLRHLLATVPFHNFTAPQPRSGKTKIVEAAAGATTGMDVVRVNYRNTDEFEKHLPLLLMSGDPLVLIDNVGSTISSHMLSTVLTAGAEFAVRKLSVTEEIRTLNRTVFTATGNQLRVGGDLPERSLLARLDPNDPNPGARSFSFDPPVRARKMFPELAAAALTAVRWYLQAGCPQPTYKSGTRQMGGFENWNRIVRGFLVTLEIGDPLATQQEVRETNVDTVAQTELLRALYEDFESNSFKLADIPKHEKGKFHKSLALLREPDKPWNSIRAGFRVANLRDRILDGLKLKKLMSESNTCVYQIENHKARK